MKSLLRRYNFKRKTVGYEFQPSNSWYSWHDLQGNPLQLDIKDEPYHGCCYKYSKFHLLARSKPMTAQ